MEQFVDVLTSLCRDLEIRYPQTFSPIRALISGDLSVIQIDLVSNQHNEALPDFVLVEQVHPRLNLTKRVLGGDIEDYEGTMRILEVTGDQRSESFLAGSVPQLEAIILGLMRQIFGKEVDADSWLGHEEMYVGCLVKSIVDVLFYDAGFAHGLAAQEDNLYLGLASHRADRVVHRNFKYFWIIIKPKNLKFYFRENEWKLGLSERYIEKQDMVRQIVLWMTDRSLQGI